MHRVRFILVVSTIILVQGQKFGQTRNTGFQQNTLASAPSQRSAYNCPEKNGRFPTGQCDAYIECVDGDGEEKLCPDGLLFNAAAGPFAFPCQYPIDVDCTGRSTTQEPQPTEDCPHQYGYYRLGDEANCGQFKNCVQGRGYVFDCPEGLAYNEESYRCDWPDQVASCNAEAYLGFTCPEVARGFGQEEYRYFRSPQDCQRYFVCIDGRPRLNNCGEGYAFNDLINACDGVENVTGCAPQYNADFDRSQNKQQNFRG